jgi:D-3-phosphoglycerate dehydrogenase
MLKAIISEPDGFDYQALYLLRKVCQVTLKSIDQNDLSATLSEYDVFWFRLKFQVRGKDIPERNKCKYIICPATGLDHIDQNACKAKGIRIISLKGEAEFLKSVRATAELALGLTISLLRNIPGAIQHVKSGGWDRDKFVGHEIYEKKVGILGVGRLGSITAGYFKSMGAIVYGFDTKNIESENCIKVNSIEDLFAVSDILSIHLSYNEQTHHLVKKIIIAIT